MRISIYYWMTFGFLAFCALNPALAQRGRGGPGGFDRSSPFRMLAQEDIRDELQLTDDQINQLKDVEEEVRAAEAEQAPRPFPEAEEERAAYFVEMRKLQETRTLATLAKIKEVLKDDQYQRLEQLRLQNIGLRALGTEAISTELKLSEQQQDELSKHLEELQALRMNFRMPRDEREKTTEELSNKILAVLSNEQKTAWEAKLGPPLREAEAAPSPPVGRAGTANSAPDTARESYTPPENEGPVVVSFDGTKDSEAADDTAPATAAKAGPAPPDKDKPIQFHLENAPWEMVLHQFARKANLTLQILQLPPGSLTYTNDDNWYTPTEALDILHGYLLQKGFVMIKRDRFLVVLNHEVQPIPPNLIPNISIAELEEGHFGKHELLNVVLPLDGAEANDAAREVDSLKGPQGSVVPLGVSNALVVTDTFTNLKRIHNLLKGVTAKLDPAELQFQSFPLKHIAAAEAEIIVRNQLGLSSGVTNVSTTSSSRYGSTSSYDRSRYGSTSSSNPSSTPTRTTTSSSRSSTPEAKVTAEPRTNRLLVTATKNQLAITEQILMTIDVSEDQVNDIGAIRMGVPYLQVYKVQTADTREVTKTLDAIMQGVVVNESGRDRTIHVKATQRQHEDVARLISQMDGGYQSVDVIPLSNKLDPAGAANTIRALFANDGNSAPIIEADTYGRRLMIRGSSDQVAQVKAFLSKMGEDGSGTGGQDKDRGPFRILPLGGRDAEEFARILEQVWGQSSDTPIRVVVPSNNPIRDRVVPSLMDQTGYPFPQVPSTQRQPRVRETDPKSTSTPSKPLFPVSLPKDKAKGKSARTEATEEINAPPATSTPQRGGPAHPLPCTEEINAPPASSTLRIGKTGEMFLNGEAVESALQLSKSMSEWLDSTPAEDRKFILSIHPETPAARFAPVLGILERSGVQYSMKMSADGEDSPQPDRADEAGPAEGNPQSATPPANNPPSVATNSGRLPITMTVRGGDLMVFDPNGEGETLDELETMIEQLALAIPPRTTWTVYYLRSAEVIETADMLRQLFPASSVSSTYDDGSFFGGLTNSISSLGTSLVGVAGLDSLNSTTLQIIPELRSNSLFVSGPADQVRQVEQMLRVLDADDLPETLRDRVPRMIPVEHANVAEVATIVKEVYKDFLEDSRQRQDRNNPLAMFMGGGGSSSNRSSRGGSSGGPSTVRMTIGVDTQTSKLVVSASDALFRQVEDVVADLDKAAYDARRTVQIMPVNESSSVVLQEALKALLPNVSVSTTSSGSSSDRGGSSSQPQTSPFGGGSSDDAARRAYYERMRSSQPSGDSTRGSFPTRGSTDGGRSSYGGTSTRGSYGGTSTRGSYGGTSTRGSYGGTSTRGR